MNAKTVLQSVVAAGAAASKEVIGGPVRATDVAEVADPATQIADDWVAVRAGIDNLPGALIVALEGSGAATLGTAAGGDGAEVLAAFLSGAIGAVAKVAGVEAAPKPAQLVEAEDVPGGAAGGSFSLAFEQGEARGLLIVEAALAADLGLTTSPVDGGDPGAGGATVAAASFPRVGSGQANGAPRDLKVLADVSMNVTVELGRTAMKVRDLLGLVPGSVVELDQAAGAPVDVLANGTLVARGDVVVVDDDLGVRITEVVQQEN